MVAAEPLEVLTDAGISLDTLEAEALMWKDADVDASIRHSITASLREAHIPH
jgi:hypothetical protein